jgi:hypothetical protein
VGAGFDSGFTDTGRNGNEAFACSALVLGAVDPAAPPPRPRLGPRRWRGGRLEPVGGGGSTVAIVILDWRGLVTL